MPGGESNTEQLAGISIGLAADVSGLRAGLAEAKRELNQAIPAEKVVRIKAILNTRGVANEVNKVKREIANLTKSDEFGRGKGLKVDLHFQATKTGYEKLKRDVRQGLIAAGGVNVPLTFAPSATESTRIRKEIEDNLKGIKAHVSLTWGWEDGRGPRLPRGVRGGPGGGGTPITPGTVTGAEPLARGPSRTEQEAAAADRAAAAEQAALDRAAAAQQRAAQRDDPLARVTRAARADISRSQRQRARRSVTTTEKAEKIAKAAQRGKETQLPEAERPEGRELNENELIRLALQFFGGKADKRTGAITAEPGSPLAPVVERLNARLDAARRRGRIEDEEREARAGAGEGRGVRGRATRVYGPSILAAVDSAAIQAQETRRGTARGRVESRRALGPEGDPSKAAAGQQRDMQRLLEKFDKIQEGLESQDPKAVSQATRALNDLLGIDIGKAFDLLSRGENEQAKALGEEAARGFRSTPRGRAFFSRLSRGLPVRSYGAEVRFNAIQSVIGLAENAMADAERQLATKEASRQGADTRAANRVIRGYQVERGLRPRSVEEDARIQRERRAEEDQSKRFRGQRLDETTGEFIEVNAGRYSVDEERLLLRRVALQEKLRDLRRKNQEGGGLTKSEQKSQKAAQAELEDINKIIGQQAVLPREKGEKLPAYRKRVAAAQAEYDAGLKAAIEEDRARREGAREEAAPSAEAAPQAEERPGDFTPEEVDLLQAHERAAGVSPEERVFATREQLRQEQATLLEEPSVYQADRVIGLQRQLQAQGVNPFAEEELPGLRRVKGGRYLRTDPALGRGFASAEDVANARQRAAEQQAAGPPGTPGGQTGFGGGGVVNVRVINPNDIAAALQATGVAGQAFTRGGQPLTDAEMQAIINRVVELGPEAAAAEVGAEYEESTPGRGRGRGRGRGGTRRRATLAPAPPGGVHIPTLRELRKELIEEEGFSPFEVGRLAAGDIEGDDEFSALNEALTGVIERQEAGIEGLEQEATELIQLIAARAVPTAALQAGQQVVGGRGQRLAQAALARRFRGRARIAARDVQDTAQAIRLTEALRQRAEERGSTGEVAVREKQIAGLNSQLQSQVALFEEASEKAAAHTKNIAGLGAAIKNIGVGTAFSIGGTLLFTTAFAGVAAAIGGIGLALQPTVERLTGYKNVTGEVTKSLAEQIRQMNGAAEAATSQRVAVAGLSAESAALVAPLIQQRATTEAGNQAFEEQINLLRASRSIAADTRGGFDQGLFQTTGGVFGTPLFGIPSTQELLGKALGELPSPEARGGDRILTDANGNLIFSLPGGTGGPFDFLAGGALGAAKQATPEELELGEKSRRFLSEQFAKGGASDIQVLNATEAQVDEVSRVADLFEQAGASNVADQLRQQQLLLTGIRNIEDVPRALQALNIAGTVPDPRLLIGQLTERILPARFEAIRAQGEFQRERQLPAQQALQRIAQPFAPRGISYSTEGLDQRTIARIGGLQLQGISAERAYAAASPATALFDLVPEDLRGAFAGVLSEIRGTATQIVDIQSQVTQAQVGQQTAEYNNQLRIARRSWQDIKDTIAGVNGAQGESLGLLQGQQIALQRQTQELQLQASELSLQLQQRQINFRVATAAFVTPGASPEERAARVAEAEAEAAFAQEQLDIQRQLLELSKQLVENAVQAQDLQLGRQLEDVSAQIELLQGARAVQQFAQAAGEELDRLNRRQQQLVEQANTFVNEGTEAAQIVMSAAQDVAAQTGLAMSEILRQTSDAWGVFSQQAQIVLDTLVGSAPRREPAPPNIPEGPDSSGRFQAPGFYGEIAGPVQVTVGEAGAETVAILRNPRNALLGGGGTSGGMTSVVVNINNPSVRDDTDLQRIASMVTPAVEQALSRKASLLGFRRPS